MSLIKKKLGYRTYKVSMSGPSQGSSVKPACFTPITQPRECQGKKSHPFKQDVKNAYIDVDM